MRILQLTSTAAIALLLGAAPPASAQHNHKGGKSGGHEVKSAEKAQKGGKEKDASVQPSHESGKQQDKPAKEAREHGQHAEKQEQHAEKHEQKAAKSGHEHHPEHTDKQSHDWQEHHGWREHGGWQGHPDWKGGRAKHWGNEHRTWAQRGGYGGYYIPHNHYGLYFGNAHWFRIRTRPVIYMGYPRFAYQSYNFIMVDPWPEYWGENWYDSDDVYIDYRDGYYLYNRRSPGIGIAVTIMK